MPASLLPNSLRVLILGGSSDATALALALVGRAGIDATLSLAGRTREPAAQLLPTRFGGFGGADGLATYLRHHAVDVLVDATHPFADQMSVNARAAAIATDTALIRVERAPWHVEPGDQWREVGTMAEAVAALGDKPVRAFLTIGRQRLAAFALAPQHHYLIRTIDPAVKADALPNAVFIQARPPFGEDAEVRLMRDHHIEVLVTKNSGGVAAYGKVAAARAIGLPVVMVRRQPASDEIVLSVQNALSAIEGHAARRGV